jgi:hypothetical protein
MFKDPVHGYQLGNKCPILHAEQDQVYPTGDDARHGMGCWHGAGLSIPRMAAKYRQEHFMHAR